MTVAPASLLVSLRVSSSSQGAAESQDLNIGGFCVVGSYFLVAGGPVVGFFCRISQIPHKSTCRIVVCCSR